MLGNLKSIGQDLAYIYTNVIGELTADGNQWKYWNGNAWKLAPNDISVTCYDDKGTF